MSRGNTMAPAAAATAAAAGASAGSAVRPRATGAAGAAGAPAAASSRPNGRQRASEAPAASCVSAPHGAPGAAESILAPLLARGTLLESGARRAAAQAKLLYTLTVQLSRFCRPAWLSKVAGLITFALLLLPAFARVGWFYLTSPKVRRNVPYGDAPRNTLDLYLPDAPPKGAPAAEPAPVVIFVTGGMWIIGYKAWGALLASRLRAAGCVVAALDYRNFPQGSVGAMTDDVSAGVGWVLRNAADWGGDPRRVTLVGQSAGAHLCALALLYQSQREQSDVSPPATFWPVDSLRGFVGVSGVYSPDDPALLDHFESKGLYKEVVWAIMDAGLSGARAAEALPRASPCALLAGGVAGFAPGPAAARLPPVTLCHGECDASSPASQSARFAAALRAAGAPAVAERYYPGKSHTDPFLEDPIMGGQDALLEDILDLAHGGPPGTAWPRFPRMLPRAVIMLARRCIPF